MADNICKSMYKSIRNSILSTFYVCELALYTGALLSSFFVLEELSFNIYRSETFINCGVDGDNNDNTCQANTQSDDLGKIRFDTFIIVVLALNILSSFGLLLVEQRRVRNKEGANELFVRQANDWLEIPGTTGLYLLMTVMVGITDVYLLSFITSIVLLNGVLNTIFVSYRITSVDGEGNTQNNNILLKYLTSFLYLLILAVLIMSFFILLSNSSEFTILWGLPIFITVLVQFIIEYTNYFFYFTALPADYKKARSEIKQTQSLIGYGDELKEKSPADYLLFFSNQVGKTRVVINSRIFVHQILHRIILLVWKLAVFGLIWYGTNNYKIDFV